MTPEIVASVLGADYTRLGDEVKELEEAGVDGIQWDVMDGRFVPNITFRHDVVLACRKLTRVAFEAHLMVVEPWHWVEAYVSAGCDRVIVHAEADPHPHRTLSVIRQAGAEAGVALNPSSSRAIVSHILDLIDMVVVMTVNPGFGGQRYLDTMEPKIGKIREMIGEREIALEVDGGIKPGTITRAHAAGADRFISGSGILGHPGGKKDAVEGLRSALYVEKVLASR